MGTKGTRNIYIHKKISKNSINYVPIGSLVPILNNINKINNLSHYIQQLSGPHWFPNHTGSQNQKDQ